MKKDLLAVIVILILGYWTIQPLLNSGFFPIHDDAQVGRVVAMGRALRGGQLPVRWVSDLGYGYGYPIFNFYGPLPYYVGGLFYAAGFSGIAATKIMFGLGIILAGVSMYFAASRFLGRAGAIVAGLFYLYAPYHAVDIYVRAAAGEFWALVFLPLVLWVVGSGKSSARAALIFGGLGLAGVILSHTILGYLTVLFYIFGLGLYILLQLFRRKFNPAAVVRAGLPLITGLSLTAFFWLPAIFEMKFTDVASQIGGGADFRDHFICLRQLWDSPWGFGGSTRGCIDGFSFKLGKLHVLLATLGFFGWFWQKKRWQRLTTVAVLSVAVAAAAILFTLDASRPVWQILPNFAYIQYPWRFLTFAIFGLSFLSGAVVVWLKSRLVRWTLVSILILVLLLFDAKLFVPQYIYPRSSADFESDLELKWRVSKISDEYLPREFVRPASAGEVSKSTLPDNPALAIDTQIDTDTYSRFVIKAERETDMIIQRVYFPGWHYLLDGHEIVAKIQSGLPHVNISGGAHTFEIRFADTPIRTIGNIISILTVLLLLARYGKKTYS